MPPNESSNQPSPPLQTTNAGGSVSSSGTNNTSKNIKKNPMALVIIILLLFIIAIVIYAIVSNHKSTPRSSVSTGPTTVQISITKAGFVPTDFTVSVGEPVIWTNNDKNPHQVASDPYPMDNELSSFNSQTPLTTGQAFSYIFNKVGTYTYHDNLNPYTIKGTVVVK